MESQSRQLSALANVASTLLYSAVLAVSWLPAAMAQEELVPPPPSQRLGQQRIVEPLFPPSPEEQAQTTDLQMIEQQLREYLEKDPNNEEAMARLGLVLLRQGRAQEAIQYLSERRSERPESAKLAVALGQAYLEAKDVCCALDLFYIAWNLDPNQTDINYWTGLAELQAGWPLQAFHTLSGGTNSRQEMEWSQRLVRGSALASLALQREAACHYQQVAEEARGTPLGQRAEELHAEMDQALMGPERFYGSFKFGVRYDDNISVIPTDNAFGLAGAPVRSAGNSYVAQFNYDLVRDYNRDVTVGYGLLNTSNFNGHAFDLLDNAVYLAANERGLMGCLPYIASMRLDYDHLGVGGDAYLGRFGATPSFTLVDSDFTSTTFLFRYTMLDFLRQGALANTILDADSDDYSMGFFRQRRLECTNLTLLGGYLYDINQSQGGNFDYQGHSLQAGFTWLLPCWDLQWTTQGNVYFRGYDNVDFIAGVERNDTEYIVQSALLYPVRDSWYLTFSWIYDRNDSNIAASDYERNLLEVGLQYNFNRSPNPGLIRQRTTY